MLIYKITLNCKAIPKVHYQYFLILDYCINTIDDKHYEMY